MLWSSLHPCDWGLGHQDSARNGPPPQTSTSKPKHLIISSGRWQTRFPKQAMSLQANKNTKKHENNNFLLLKKMPASTTFSATEVNRSTSLKILGPSFTTVTIRSSRAGRRLETGSGLVARSLTGFTRALLGLFWGFIYLGVVYRVLLGFQYFFWGVF